MNLTTEVERRILKQNEGFTAKVNCTGRNFSAERIYTIVNGKLHIKEVGRNFLVDNRYSEERIADENNIHMFLYDYKYKLNLEGIE